MSDIKIESRASKISVSQSLSSFVEQQISGPSTWYMVLLPVQGGTEQSQFPNVHIRESIKKHIQLSETLSKAADEILYEKKDIIDIALSYDLDVWILERKVHILKRTNNYLAIQFQYAMDKLYAYFNDNLTQKDLLYYRYVAEECDIGIEYIQHLREEYRRYKLKGLNNYIYEKITISYGVFTSSQEESLLQRLNKWKEDYSYFKCHCQLCALEYLVSLAYKFAKEKKISYPFVWNINKGADELWLLEFEMRNSVEIVRFPPASSCTKESPVSTCAWESSSLFEQEISEPSTTSRAQGDIGSSQLPNVLKPEEKLNKIKGWIKKHVEISDQLDKAAKRVLQKNKDIGEVAHKHKLDLWMLNRKVHVLKFRKTQFDIKRDHEDAVNAVKFNILSVSSAAKEYGVDKDVIRDKLKKLKYLNSNVYVHDEKPKTNDTVFEWDEEFLLLNNLQRQVSDDPNCDCRSCALQKLPSLAYEFAKQKKQRYPFAWNITGKADVIWTCEFIMRHSIEISNYFQKECMADLLVLTNSSESF